MVQRLLDETNAPDEDAAIKIAVGGSGDEVRTVYFRGFTHEGLVRYSEDAPATLGKKKGKKARTALAKKNAARSTNTIDARHAFVHGTKQGQIVRELDQLDDAEEALGDLDVGEGVIDHIVETLGAWVEQYGVDIGGVAITPSRVALLIARDSQLAEWCESLDLIEQYLEDDAGPKDPTFGDLASGIGGLTTKAADGVGSAGSGKNKPDWKHDKTKARKGKILGELPDGHILEGEKSTLHHKMSRHNIGLLLDLPGAERGLSPFLRKVSEVTGIANQEKAFKNWPANIELGVFSDAVEKDPGSAFDGNYPDGIATPRTELLEGVDAALSAKAIDWADLNKRLLAVQAEHERQAKEQGVDPTGFTLPLLSQWKDSGEGDGSFLRDRPVGAEGLTPKKYYPPTKKSAKKRGDFQTSVERLSTLGFTRHPQPGDANDCAIHTLHHQLTTVHGLDVGDFAPFRDHVRTTAAFAFGSMIDILNNGAALLTAAQSYLHGRGVDANLTINVWSGTGDGGLFQFNDVAHSGTIDDATPYALLFYFNGVNHFDSLTHP
ncbi:MAG: hypothetical protein AAF567_05840 [Actinomycetota bacterium]